MRKRIAWNLSWKKWLIHECMAEERLWLCTMSRRGRNFRSNWRAKQIPQVLVGQWKYLIPVSIEIGVSLFAMVALLPQFPYVATFSSLCCTIVLYHHKSITLLQDCPLWPQFSFVATLHDSLTVLLWYIQAVTILDLSLGSPCLRSSIEPIQRLSLKLTTAKKTSSALSSCDYARQISFEMSLALLLKVWL